VAAGLDFDMTADFRQAERLLHGMQTKAVRAAANSALNKAMKTVERIAVRQIAGKVGLNMRDTRRYMRVRRSTRRTLETALIGTGKRIPVHLRQARQTKRGVTYKGIGGKRRLIKGAYFPGGDVKRGAFKRVGRQRLPVTFLRTVSIPFLMKQRAFEDAVNAIAAPRFRELFSRELRFYLQRYG